MSDSILKDLRVLVVDDEPDLRDLYREELEFAGAQVTIAASGNQAIALVAENRFDLVLSDMCMPEGTGLDLLEHLKAQNKRMPFVMISAYSEMSPEEIRKRGAREIVSKPVDWDSFLPECRRFVDESADAQNS